MYWSFNYFFFHSNPLDLLITRNDCLERSLRWSLLSFGVIDLVGNSFGERHLSFTYSLKNAHYKMEKWWLSHLVYISECSFSPKSWPTENAALCHRYCKRTKTTYYVSCALILVFQILVLFLKQYQIDSLMFYYYFPWDSKMHSNRIFLLRLFCIVF